MEMFAQNDDVACLEAAVPSMQGVIRLHALVTLAWQLRQRDTKLALDLVDQAIVLQAKCVLDAASAHGITARLLLIRCEAHWLLAKLDEAETLAQQALRLFMQDHDEHGCADAHYLLSWIAADRGNWLQRDAAMAAAIASAMRCADMTRATICQTTAARWDVFRDMRNAILRWNVHFAQNQPGRHPAEMAAIADYQGMAAGESGDLASAVGCFIQTYELAMATGQTRRAIFATMSVGESFNKLNDHHAALEWMERGLELARSTGWPGSLGVCLMQCADTLRRLGRLDAAQELLQEAFTIMTPLVGSRSYTLLLLCLAEVALDRGDYACALDNFTQLREYTGPLDQADLQTNAWRGLAHTLAQLNRVDEALVTANKALSLAQQNNDANNQIAALRVLADIHQRNALPPPTGMTSASATLHYLRQALAVAAAIDGYAVSGDLLDALANAHAEADQYREAFEYVRAANLAREKIDSKDVVNRAIAMQVQIHSERTHAESEHHRQLAISEAKRAEVLQQTTATLERLGAIGQEITAHLNTQAVVQALCTHVHGLLHVSTFVIYLMDPDQQSLSSALHLEDERILPKVCIPLSDPLSNCARCARERRVVIFELEPGGESPTWVAGTLNTLSSVFAPLIIGDKIIGVITIQSMFQHAYGERELLIFRTLCAYGAIALENANTYQQLETTIITLNQAQAEARQAEILRQTSATLEHLSAIGQEITAHLNASAVFQTLDRHVHDLLDASSFAIYLMDDDAMGLTTAFAVEAGRHLPPKHIALSDPTSSAARCMRERREVLIERNAEQIMARPTHEPPYTLTRLFAPLTIGERMLGAMTIQSLQPMAYAERERLIFRTLCAYGAIALDNASAYRQLEATLKTLNETQAQLVQREKMASLGTLTAGIAHEINNPANFAHVGAHALRQDLEKFRAFLLELAGDDAGAAILASLNKRIDGLATQIATIVEGTTRIRNLVLDLRTFSRLDQAAKKEVLIADSLISTVNLVRTKYLEVAEIRCDLAANPMLECFPAELNQVFMNLIVNACQAIQSKPRAEGDKTPGLLSIRSRIEDKLLLIEFEDNGCGIPKDTVSRIFEPFFTTKTVGEGMGMGLSISFGIIEKHQGNLKVTSVEGEGTCFTLMLPLAAEA